MKAAWTFLTASVAITAQGCQTNSTIQFDPKSEIALARYPVALQERIIDAGYVPWDPLRGSIMPGDVLQLNPKKFEWRYSKQQCFPSIHAAQEAVKLDIASVTIDKDSGAFSLEFLNVNQNELSKNRITQFEILLSDVRHHTVPSSLLEYNNANTAQCRYDLQKEDHVAVSGILKGKIGMKFFSDDALKGRINVSHTALKDLNLEAKGYTSSSAQDSIISTDHVTLGFEAPGRSAQDLLSPLGLNQRKLREAGILASYTLSQVDKDVEVQMYKVITEFEDRAHQISQDIIELWLEDVDYTLTKYQGQTLTPKNVPLTLTTFTTGKPGQYEIFDQISGNPIHYESIQRFAPIKVRQIPVGKDFKLVEVSKDRNTFCKNNREYDFYTFTGSSRFKNLQGLTFMFFVKKNMTLNYDTIPIEIVELAERSIDGQKMYLPEYLTDFMVDNLRKDHGEEAMSKLFGRAVQDFKKAFPQERTLETLNARDFEGYRVTLLSGARKYAVSFRCGVSRLGHAGEMTRSK